MTNAGSAPSSQMAALVEIEGEQAVLLPPGFEFSSDEVAIRREGDRVILKPIARSAAAADRG